METCEYLHGFPKIRIPWDICDKNMRGKSVEDFDPKNGFVGRYWIYLLPLLFVVVIIMFYPFRYVFEFDTDEGIQLIKGLLHARGYRLYTDIYNDQPPIFTLVLSLVFQILRSNVTAARLIVLAFSSLLLISSLAYLSIFWGQPHAIFGFLFLILLPFFIRLSVSVMIGLPAISLAVTSFLALTLWHKYHNIWWLILSAGALSLSIMIKLFAAILIPIFIIGILADEFKIPRANRSWADLLKPFLIWSSTFGFALGLMLMLFVGLENITQFFEVHLAAGTTETFADRARAININSYLRGSWTIFLVAIIGTSLAIRRQAWSALYLSAWMVAGYFSLVLTTPVWYHHQLLISVPAALLAGIFAGELMDYLSGRKYRKSGLILRNIAFTIGAFALILFSITRITAIFRHLEPGLPNLKGSIDPDTHEYPILALMSDHLTNNDLIVTDRPMFAFRLAKLIPPELAVISDKRLRSGSLDEEFILELILDKKPEQILFGRYAFDQIEQEIETEYRLAYGAGRYRLYFRK